MRHTIVLGLILAAAGSAQAGYANNLDIQIDFNGQTWVMSQYPQDWTTWQDDGGTVFIRGESTCFQDGQGGQIRAQYELQINTDSVDGARGFPVASVTSNFTLTNSFPVTNNFSVVAVLPISIPFGSTGMRGSFSGSVIDNSGSQNGATVAALNGGSMYEALIDASIVRTLRNDPFGVTAPGGGTASLGTVNFGVPAFEAGPAATTSIAIRNAFSLTADDSVTNSSTFIITPAPGAVALAGMAGLVGIRRRR